MTFPFVVGRRAGASRPQQGSWGLVCAVTTFSFWMTGTMGQSKSAKAAWDQSLAHTIEQACERAISRMFSGVRDEAARHALAQAFLAGVDWCFSEQSDNDIAEAALAIGLDP